MLTKKTINKIKVKPIPIVNKIDTSKIMGGDLFDLYTGICIIGRTGSGKTSLINEILYQTTNRLTTVILFSSTIFNDQNWIYICDSLDKRGTPSIKHTSLIDESDNSNILDSYVDLFRAQKKEEQETKNQPKKPKKYIIDDSDEKESKMKPPKKIACKYFFVLDDMSDELKNRSLSSLIKKSRHFESKLLVSTQYYCDVEKSARNQFRYWCLYGGISEDKLDQLHSDIGLSIAVSRFKGLYKDATSEQYNFLFFDKILEKFRKNLDEEYST